MDTVWFVGGIVPEFVKISLGVSPTSGINSHESGKQIIATLIINDSVVTIKCELDKYEASDFIELRQYATELMNTSLALAGFSTGLGVIGYLDIFYEPDGYLRPIHIGGNTNVAAECTAFTMDAATPEARDALSKVFEVVLMDNSLPSLLIDLQQVLNRQSYGPINCGRVIDGLRKLVAPTLDPIRGWPVLQQIVNVDSGYLKYISEHSKDPRHGDISPMPISTVNEIVQRTWVVMNRYLEYRKRGNQPLPLTEFPMRLG